MNEIMISEIGIEQDAEGRYCLNEQRKAAARIMRQQNRAALNGRATK